MKVTYIAQPDTQLGKVLSEMLDATPSASSIIFVSAFVSLQTIIRIKQQILELKRNGVDIRFVLGIDLGGTSQEVLQEMLKWEIDTRIVKHRIPGHTFHPKLYLFEWEEKGVIIIGSNNITEGGFFGNYEGAACITYSLPEEANSFADARSELRRFLEPDNPVSYRLTKQLLTELAERREIPTEAEARSGRSLSNQNKTSNLRKSESIFGIEDISPPPPLPLPTEILEGLVENIRARRTRQKRLRRTTSTNNKSIPSAPIDDQTGSSLQPAAFYMTLPKLQGENIPGEGRIPLDAIELAKEFWGWPDEYERTESPRAGDHRVYWNWRPTWTVWSADSPDNAKTQEVRMYMYENSSDFRFYVRPLVNEGGDLGDVIRIRRIALKDIEYECVLARKGTEKYDEWIKSCTQKVRNSTRRFGYT